MVSGLKAKPHAGHRSKAPSTTPKAWIVAGLFGRLQELGLPAPHKEALNGGHFSEATGTDTIEAANENTFCTGFAGPACFRTPDRIPGGGAHKLGLIKAVAFSLLLHQVGFHQCQTSEGA